ncbi:MAG: SAM-dependent methyltransferase [Gammaproteobacteria bacterium]|nr:MAG: SAM-dependent methyltransferase [Gammaproteobacteria bacterium]
MSAAVLAYEVLLMALFSLIQWHHFAYLVVSIALLGFGISGSLLVYLAPRLRHSFRGFATSQACLFALSSLLGFGLAQRLSFNPEELIWDPAHWIRLALVILLLMLPFLFAANLIGMALIEFRERLSRIYAADLLGAGVGALGIIGLLYLMTPTRALLLVATFGLAAAAAVWIECRGRAWPALSALILAGLALQLLPTAWTEPVISPYKELSQILRIPGTRIVEQRSSPLGWLSVVESPNLPLRHAPGLSLNARAEPPPQLALFTDAGGMSAITRYRGERDEIRYLDDMTSALPYHLQQPRHVLLLGSGGGADVLQALYHGVEHIDAVELNPQVIELVRDRFADFSGRIYSPKHANLHIDEARGFLQRGDKTYDLIQIPLLDSFAGAAGGVHGLNENYLYTVEAIQQALRRLETNGFIVLTRWLRLPPRDSLKLFATAIAALERSGMGDAGQHLLLIRGLQTTTLLIKKGTISGTDIERLRTFCRQRAFDLAYYPGMPASEANRHNRLQSAYFYDAAQALLGSGRERYLRQYKFDLTPSTDDRPFHFHFVKWGSLAELLEIRHRGGSALLETSYLTLLVALLLGLILSLALILVPLLFIRSSTTPTPVRFAKTRVFTYFAALGLGFLLIEIAFLQKFILLLHHPLYAAAVVLASFLVAAGFGSAWAQRYAGSLRARRACFYAVLGIVLLGGAGLMLHGPLLQLAGSWSLAARIGLSILLIAPLGFCMGMPFPLGLTSISIGAVSLTPWAWGINGCASVISAVLASLLAIHFGFNLVILVAMACYLLAIISYPVAAGGLEQGLMVKNPTGNR